ncbi:MAG: AAA family ATPase [Planctomycetota bacterium]
MKLAISGKGGVGKTTLTALLARRLAERGRGVLAADADPDANLAAALGFPSPDEIVPLAEMKELIGERMGTEPGAVGAYFKLNPKVDDLPAKYCIEHNGLRLIVMGMVKRGGAGCACPENMFLKALLDHVLLGPDEDVLVDMEAGLEHLGRATAAAVDGLVVVVEPSLRSIETLHRIRRLAADIGLERCWPVANKVSCEEDHAFLSQAVPGDGLAACVPASEAIAAAGRGRGSLLTAEDGVWQAVDSVLEKIHADLS